MNQALINLANGIHAAAKIQAISQSDVYNNSSRNSSSISMDKLDNMLRVLLEYSPEPHRSSLESTYTKSNEYVNVYKGIKNHIRNSSGKRLNKDNIIDTIGILKPVLTTQQRLMFEVAMHFYNTMQ